VRCAAITLCVASERVFIVVVYCVIDSVRKLLDTRRYVLIYRLRLTLPRIRASSTNPH
jgi:hypothetical protein